MARRPERSTEAGDSPGPARTWPAAEICPALLRPSSDISTLVYLVIGAMFGVCVICVRRLPAFCLEQGQDVRRMIDLR
jgi:hypothetical protein